MSYSWIYYFIFIKPSLGDSTAPLGCRSVRGRNKIDFEHLNKTARSQSSLGDNGKQGNVPTDV